jgi:hypothetical protein
MMIYFAGIKSFNGSLLLQIYKQQFDYDTEGVPDVPGAVKGDASPTVLYGPKFTVMKIQQVITSKAYDFLKIKIIWVDIVDIKRNFCLGIQSLPFTVISISWRSKCNLCQYCNKC